MERIANYTLLQRIAVSETSEISLARGDSQNVAIKRILSPKHNASDHAAQSLSKDLQSDEFTFASAIRHENLVSTYEILQEGSSFVAVMEWVDGYDLRQIGEQATLEKASPLCAAYSSKQDELPCFF